VRGINLKSVFSNKHRAYLLIFAIGFLALRLPLLIENKIGRIASSVILHISQQVKASIRYSELKVAFPASVSINNLEITSVANQTIAVPSVKIIPRLRYPLLVDLEADVYQGKLICKLSRGIFSAVLRVDCNVKDLEISEIPQVQQFNIRGPLSFRFNGDVPAYTNNLKLKGEFLSQIDTGKLVLPKEIPSFIKLPNLGIIDLRGQFDVLGSEVKLTDSRLSSTMGDVDANLTLKFDKTFSTLTETDSSLDIKLSAGGTQAVGPWLGLMLGGAQFPASGEGKVLIKGNSASGFKASLGSK
jgi:hypothetical protein